MQRKNQLRQECKRIRNSLEADHRFQASLAICQHVADWNLFQEVTTILAYMAMGSEVDLSPLLLQSADKIWAIPRVQPAGRMVFHKFDPDALIRHRYGMLEPDPACTVIAPEAVHLILVPGLAFDPEGWRLGYGGGFYDRYLAKSQGAFAGISYQSLLKTGLPHDAHDIPMQYIITENGISPTPYLSKEIGHQSI